MKQLSIPEYWLDFIHKNNLIFRDIEFPWPGEIDFKAIIEILNEDLIIAESTEAYPGIAIAKDGYLPVAGCGVGTGDQYCINVNDGIGGPLYLVDHERAGHDDYNQSEAVKIMLKDYREMLSYIK